MLENLKDQINSLWWLRTEMAPAVTNQTRKTRWLLHSGARKGADQPAPLPTACTFPAHRTNQFYPEVCTTGGRWWLFTLRMLVWMRKWGLHIAKERLSSRYKLYAFVILMQDYIPVPSWSRWWQRWTSKQVNWITTLKDGTNQGVKQESILVQAANAVGVTSWSHALCEPESLSELQKVDNKVVV